jgi:hypothetical protein
MDPEWGGPVVDLVEEERVVGVAYVEDGVLCAEFYPDEEGEAWVFHAESLQRVLDTATAMLLDEEEPDEAAGGVHPVDVLAMEFDSLAARRGPEDEGFYPLGAAARILARCDDLDLAMVIVEGLDLHPDRVEPVPGCSTNLAKAYEGEPWALFRASCNTQARAVLERWPRRSGFGVAMEIQDRAGDRYVL